MASLQLPPPRKAPVAPPPPRSASSSSGNGGEEKKKSEQQQPSRNNRAPSYEERCRSAAQAVEARKEGRRLSLFVPRQLRDFDDGGAFPEIHVAQYPRHMGNPHVNRGKEASTNSAGRGGGGGAGAVTANAPSKALVTVEVDEKGDVSYDAIVKGGTNKDKIVYSKLSDLKPGEADEQAIALPTEEEEREEAAKTQAALQALLAKKTALDKPSGSAMINAATSKNVEQETQFIKYTARPDAPGYNPAAANRVIQMVPAQVDPMMPPKHRHVKAPRGPAEDPVPVLHAPVSKKLTKEERDAWNVPSCISNWKNTRGYTIPLDKRLAADGRGLRDEGSINSAGFAALSESLYVAERQARQEVRMRAQVQKKLAMAEKEEREEELRNLAHQARLERGGGAAAAVHATTREEIDEPPKEQPDRGHVSDESSESESSDDEEEQRETEDQVAARQREKLRLERKRERERELRVERNMELKKKQRLEEERDVSEKIALGVYTGSGGGDNVDSRLYSQTAGMDSGFGRDDDYNAYSKPLFEKGAASQSIYRPTRGETEYNADEQYDKLKSGVTSKFQPDKGFGGAEGGMEHQAGPRTAPVQFEKAQRK